MQVEGLDTGQTVTARVDVRVTLRDLDDVRQYIKGLLLCLAGPALVSQGMLLVHGCAMVSPETGKATLFLGPSGSGKTTMASRLPGRICLADDSVLVDVLGDAITVSGTVLPGTEGLLRHETPSELAQVVTLVPNSEVLSLTPLDEAALFEAWLDRVFWFMPTNPLVPSLASLLSRLADRVNGFRLESALVHDVAGLLDTVPGRKP